MATMSMSILALCLLSLLVYNANAQRSNGVYKVTNYGAKADGKSDINKAVLSAWKEACALASPSKIVIPKGEYLLSQVTLEGPCQGPVEVQVDGNVKAPAEPSAFNYIPDWVTFNHINQLTLSGFGTFDGQGGKVAWIQNDCHINSRCKTLPINIRFNFITNGLVKDITSLNSKQFHVNVLGCKNLTFTNVNIIAPDESPNTDGIHIGRSSGINIIDSIISTGDDCVSLGDGSKQITVSRVTCGPGHGISIGSLGKYENEEPVVGVTVVNCTLTNTMNGVRVKTWPDSFDGIVSDLHFEDIVMVNVSNPVLIEQVYCPHNKCNKKVPSRIKISNVSFKNIRGTSATPLAVNLVCSSGIPCENVALEDIDLSYTGKEGPVTSQCSNVKPKVFGQQNPPACGTSANSRARKAK